MTITRRRGAAAAAVGLVLARAGAAAAQQGIPAEAAFPLRPVRLIVPFPAGGAADTLSRTTAEGLRALWGQPVVVENLSGAGGNVGAAAFARAEPDGHTLLSSPPGPIAINAALYRQLAYDPQGFAPVTVLAKVPNVVAVNAELGLRGVRERAGVAGRHRRGGGVSRRQGKGAGPSWTRRTTSSSAPDRRAASSPAG